MGYTWAGRRGNSLGLVTVAGLLLVGFFGIMVSLGTAKELTPISFSVDFIIDGKYAPWYVALDKGFYAEEGLDVSIHPGSGSQAVLQRLAAGTDQIVFADLGGLVLARAAGGGDDKMVAVLYAKPPYAIFSLKKDNITSLDTLRGKTIASNTGSPVEAIFNIVARQLGYDPGDFRWVEVDPSAKMQLLIAGRVDAAENYVVAEPIYRQATASEGGVNVLRLSDYGLTGYSNGLVVSNAYLQENPDIVKAFVKASLRGFEYTFAYPEEAVAIMLRRFPTLDPEVARQQIEVLKDLAYGPGTAENGLGYMDPATVQTTVDLIAEVYDLASIPRAEELFTNEALPGR